MTRPPKTRAARAVVLALGVLTVAAVLTWGRPQAPRPAVPGPEFSAEAKTGKQSYDRHCSQCHGDHGAGSATGPPLVDRTYHPALHADVAFELAVRRGVPAHHWRFGDMPPQPGVSQAEVAQITRYVRELQRAKGIH